MIIFEHDNHRLDLDDLPLEVYADIHDKTQVPWYELSARPVMNAKAAGLLAVACAKHLGIELPTPTPKLIVSWFKVEDGDSRPAEYTDGVPDPKADDQATS